MGFSLECFFADLEAILAKDQKAAKTIKELARGIADAKAYAIECGQMKERP
jgi:hypothetical protein